MSSLIVFFIFCTVLYFVHRHLRMIIDSFKYRRIIYNEPKVIFGNVGKVFFRTQSFSEVIEEIYEKFEDEKILGFFNFHRPQLIIRDPKIVHKILVDNFDHFNNHIENLTESLDRISGQACEALKNNHWREMRSNLDVLFSDDNIHQMSELMMESTSKLIEYLEAQSKLHEEFIIDIKDISEKFVLNSMASIVFGSSKVNCFKNNRERICEISDKVSQNFSMIGCVKTLIANVFPNIYQALNLQLVDNQTKEFLHQAVLEEMKVRQVKKSTQPDMIQLLLKAKDGQLHDYGMKLSPSEVKELKSDEIFKKFRHITWPDDSYLAIAYSFLKKGTPAIKCVLETFCFELAKNFDNQMELIDEIDEINAQIDGVTVADLNKMDVLNKSIFEVLRLWPPIFTATRVCTKNYELCMVDGYKFEFQKGDELIIPIVAIQHDAKYFEHPLTFNPHRFDNKRIEEAEYLPFGIGPRSCILRNFSMQLVKIFIHQLLTHFTLEMCHKTPSMIQLKHSFEFDVEGKIYMRLKSRRRN